MRILIAAGGTGGHIYPAIALAQELKSQSPDCEILFLGSEEGLERDLVTKAGFELKLIKARALLRKLSYKALSAPFICAVGFFQALRIIKEFSPRFLVSFGGYVSLPAALAAISLGCPLLIHEQNILPGMTNRFLARFADKVFLSFEESKNYLSFDKSKGCVVGNPVRREIFLADRAEARQKLGYGPDDLVVMVVGGSQGARKINEVLVRALPRLKEIKGLKLFHIVGKRDSAWINQLLGKEDYPFYQKADYLYNMAEVLAAADLVISRAGATALAEFMARGLPMILIPFPFSAEGHQKLNASWAEEKGAAIVIEDELLSVEELCRQLEKAIKNLKVMSQAAMKLARKDAAKTVAHWILEYE